MSSFVSNEALYCSVVVLPTVWAEAITVAAKITIINKPIANSEDIINKDLNISSIEFYSRHIWFGPKGTSINLTLNKCGISYDAPVYDMDDLTDDIENINIKDIKDTEEEEVEETVESDSVEDSDSDEE